MIVEHFCYFTIYTVVGLVWYNFCCYGDSWNYFSVIAWSLHCYIILRGAKSALIPNFVGQRMKAPSFWGAKSALLHNFAGQRMVVIDPKSCEKFKLPTIYRPNVWNHIAYTYLHTICNLIPHHALLVFSFKVERDKLSERQFVHGLRYLGSLSGHCPPCMLFSRK